MHKEYGAPITHREGLHVGVRTSHPEKQVTTQVVSSHGLKIKRISHSRQSALAQCLAHRCYNMTICFSIFEHPSLL